VECEGGDHVVGLMQETTIVVEPEEGMVMRKERVDATGVVRGLLTCVTRKEGWVAPVFLA
jgi:hypothetical protein